MVDHSPTGFSWGYGGSGPAQLALALLLEMGLSNAAALSCYQLFKLRFIAVLPDERFEMAGAFILGGACGVLAAVGRRDDARDLYERAELPGPAS